MSQRATYGRCYKGAHRGSCQTECAAVLHRPKSRATGVKQREVCKEGESGREREGVGFCRVGNIEKCRQPNLLDIYNGQTGQLVTANLPTCNAAQAQPERVGSTRYPGYPSSISFLPPFLQLSVMRMWDYLRCLRQAAAATAAANGIYQLRHGVEGEEEEGKRWKKVEEEGIVQWGSGN